MMVPDLAESSSLGTALNSPHFVLGNSSISRVNNYDA